MFNKPMPVFIEMGDIVDMYTVTIGTSVYYCYAREPGLAINSEGWAVKRVTSGTDGGGYTTSTVRWAVKAGRPTTSKYFAFTAASVASIPESCFGA